MDTHSLKVHAGVSAAQAPRQDQISSILYSHRRIRSDVLFEEVLPPHAKQIAALLRTEVPGARWVEVPKESRDLALGDILEIYEAAYGRNDVRTRYHRPDELIARTGMWFVATDATDKPVAFATFSESKNGLRLGLIGAEPTSGIGRRAVAALIGTMAHVEGVYGNMSGKVAQIAVARGAEIVPYDEVKGIMGTFRGTRGLAAAQRDVSKIRSRMMTETEFSCSPIVREAIARTGRERMDVSFEDLIDQAVRNGEIPDSSEARKNCFGVVQTLEGLDGSATPTLVVKIMIRGKEPSEFGGRLADEAATGATVLDMASAKQTHQKHQRCAPLNPEALFGVPLLDFLHSVAAQVPGALQKELRYSGAAQDEGGRLVRFRYKNLTLEIRLPEGHENRSSEQRLADCSRLLLEKMHAARDTCD